jgi:hypothetical protein
MVTRLCVWIEFRDLEEVQLLGSGFWNIPNLGGSGAWSCKFSGFGENAPTGVRTLVLTRIGLVVGEIWGEVFPFSLVSVTAQQKTALEIGIRCSRFSYRRISSPSE